MKPYPIGDLVQRYGREHVAAEAQHALEEEVKNIIFPWMEREQTRNLPTSGGVMLDVKLHQRLRESDHIALHHTYPNAGDSGLAVARRFTTIT
jgi:predicted NodU family carbamoyl transferase